MSALDRYIEDPSDGAVAVFLSGCVGIRLVTRGKNDPHLCFQVLVEDDGNWFFCDGRNGWSTSWLNEYIDVAEQARRWCEQNAKEDGGFGWTLKNEESPVWNVPED